MAELKKEQYFYALGRRKTSTATVRVFKSTGKSIINGKTIDNYYPVEIIRNRLNKPFDVSELAPKDFYFTVKVEGGGKMSQLEAISLGISRAIVKMDETKKTFLKKAGLLTRDSRMVERKKTGLKKARKREQYSKR